MLVRVTLLKKICDSRYGQCLIKDLITNIDNKNNDNRNTKVFHSMSLQLT